MKQTTALRHLLDKPGILAAPGAYDALSALLVQEAGFPAVYVTGSGIAHSNGWPDLGLVTLTEVIDRVGKIADAVGVPVIADADTGYGNAINLMRTVHLFEKAGVAGIHIEDQVTPKRCGHYEGKSVVPKEEAVKKIEAALEARQDKDFVIIARTDARAVNGFEDAIDRARAYREAGADAVFVEAVQSQEEWRLVPKLVDAPCLANMVKEGKSPPLTVRQLEEMGYRIVIFAGDIQRAAIYGMREVLKELKEKGSNMEFTAMAGFQDRAHIVGLDRVQELERRFLSL
ncbi:MAG: isocitrate lyase/PEP mutase family protein [Chloroflexi bacterium]|nr:isocitrate lyase/PEP mutase family protein [Chloroflexota bacterium]